MARVILRRPVPRIVFTAVHRFDPSLGELWTKFIAWSRLTHLREVVSLDVALCPNFFVEMTAEDWDHVVPMHHKLDRFDDCEYVRRRVGNERVHVLAVCDEPSVEDLASFVDPRFVFRGCDLVEDQTGISALVNCGGFDKAFFGGSLSEYGLLADPAEARRVQERLRLEYPGEPHADCRLWAIWQMLSA